MSAPEIAITAPTEISVPREEATTSVIPIAKITNSPERFKMSMIEPYSTPLLIFIEKKFTPYFAFVTIALKMITAMRAAIGSAN